MISFISGCTGNECKECVKCEMEFTIARTRSSNVNGSSV